MSNTVKPTSTSLSWMESVALYSCRIDGQGRILSCSSRLAEHLGASDAEALEGSEFVSAVTDDPEALQTQIAPTLGGSLTARLFRAPLRGNPNSVVRWYLCKISEAEGESTLLALGWDGSTIVDLEHFLMREVRVVELTEETVVITNARGIVEFVNPAFTAATGYGLDEIVGRSLAGIVNVPEEMSSVQKALGDFQRGESWEGVLRVRRRDGEAVTVGMRIHPVRGSDGSNSHFIAIGRDLSQQQRLQRQIEELQRLESLSTLANGLAHRFNNILAAISGQTELLLMMPGKDVPRRAERILEAASKGKEVVEQLTSFGRRNEPRSRPADVVPVLRNALKFIKAAQPRSVRIEENLPEASSLVMANTGEIHQVLLNILTNALEALCERSDGRIEVSLVEEPHVVDPQRPAIPCVVIRVSDNGPGVPPEIRHRIFEPFFTTRSLASSTGMGLATAHGIMTRHGGCVYCDENECGGATFTLVLPLLHATRQPSDNLLPADTKGRVLLVDNAGFALEAGQRMLQSLNYDVVALADPNAVREILRDPSLAIGMLVVPSELKGESTLPMVREARRLRKDLPVLLCASLNDAVDVGAARSSGVTEIIRKPLPVEEFADAVNALMQP